LLKCDARLERDDLRVAGEARKRIDIAIGFFQPVQTKIEIGLEQVKIRERPDFADRAINRAFRRL
jgi:hypothetical protein